MRTEITAMSLRSLFTIVLLACGQAWAGAPPAIPDTPAGHALAAWLEALDSGERTQVEAFSRTWPSFITADSLMQWRTQTGGYDLLAIHASEPADVIFRVKARTGPDHEIEEIGRIRLQGAPSAAITELGTWRIPPGARFEPVTLDAAARARLVDGVARMFEDFYVFPQAARQMSAAVRQRAQRGEYASLVDGEDFARKLTADLREVSHDRHVEVHFSLVVQAQEPQGPDEESVARARLAASNCYFEKAEHLPPNIGYLKFDGFADAGVCAATADAAMTFLADSDALILDLRDNHGGQGAMVQLLASYLFAGRTHLNDTDSRQGAAVSTEESWTLPYVPGRKFLGKPVFVLTSKGTFSAAEDLAYVLQTLKRATLIGETTGGGAHPVDVRRIDEHFSVRVPYARSISPVTGTDWEGRGVEPDIQTPAADALNRALERARASSSEVPGGR
jgi:hypothetical protein